MHPVDNIQLLIRALEGKVLLEDLHAVAKFPHCDERVLHKPGSCQFCDMHPEWQQDRIKLKINFTGEQLLGYKLCPSDAKRVLGGAHGWIGNRPVPEGCECGYFQLKRCPIHDEGQV